MFARFQLDASMRDATMCASALASRLDTALRSPGVQ
jgi:hypothetical protein